MMKYTIFFAALVVSTLAAPMFPHFGGYQNANNFDQDDGIYQGQQGVGAQNQGNEIGDTPDDQDEQQFGPGVAPQAGTTVAPAAGGSSSDSSSSEEDMGAGAGGALTTAAPAQPVGPLAPQAGPDVGAGQAGENSDSNTNVISQVDAAPIGAGNPDPGNTSGEQNTANANPLNMQAQEQKQQESRRSSAAVSVTTMILVAGVAATAAVTYKYKNTIRNTIRERIGI